MTLIRHAERRRRAGASAELPDLFELVIVGIRSGLASGPALTMALSHSGSEVNDAFDEVRLLLERGHRLADAMDALPHWLGPEAQHFVDALVAADRYGLPLAPILDQLSRDVRIERTHRSQRGARTLPVKLSFPLVVCTLPSFVLLAIAPAVLGAVSTITAPP